MEWYWWALLILGLFLVLWPFKNRRRLTAHHTREHRRQRSRRTPAAAGRGASSRVGTAGAVNWSELLDRPDVLVLDTETTGLGPEAEVIEIAVIDTTGAVLLDTLSLPQDHIPKAASDIHGLTYDRLKRTDAPPWPEVHDQLLTVLEGVSVVLGWNVSFDRRVLQQTAKRHGLRLHKLSWRDLLADYRAIRPTGRHRLGDAANREGVTVKGSAHRALTDCQTVLAVMQSVADGRLY